MVLDAHPLLLFEARAQRSQDPERQVRCERLKIQQVVREDHEQSSYRARRRELSLLVEHVHDVREADENHRFLSEKLKAQRRSEHHDVVMLRQREALNANRNN